MRLPILVFAVLLAGCVQPAEKAYTSYDSNGIHLEYPKDWRVVSEQVSGEVFSAGDSAGTTISVSVGEYTANLSDIVQSGFDAIVSNSNGSGFVEFESAEKAVVFVNYSSDGLRLSTVRAFIACGNRVVVAKLLSRAQLYQKYEADFKHSADSLKCA
ncbi:hypothetical protein HYS54_00890 [Candidatus Micrarchaeota archaeon]|nr:hypothetical protein [Candidatus Micrarchaeota archaeon]